MYQEAIIRGVRVGQVGDKARVEPDSSIRKGLSSAYKLANPIWESYEDALAIML